MLCLNNLIRKPQFPFYGSCLRSLPLLLSTIDASIFHRGSSQISQLSSESLAVMPFMEIINTQIVLGESGKLPGDFQIKIKMTLL